MNIVINCINRLCYHRLLINMILLLLSHSGIAFSCWMVIFVHEFPFLGLGKRTFLMKRAHRVLWCTLSPSPCHFPFYTLFSMYFYASHITCVLYAYCVLICFPSKSGCGAAAMNLFCRMQMQIISLLWIIYNHYSVDTCVTCNIHSNCMANTWMHL